MPKFIGPEIVGRVLCFLGLHEYELIDVTFGFGSSGSISKLRCCWCGKIKTKMT